MAAAGVAPADATLLPLAESARRNDPAALDRAAQALADTPLVILQPTLAAWSAFAARGEVPAEGGGGDPLARRFLTDARPLLLIAAGRTPDALASLRTQGGAGPPPLDTRVAAAQLLFGKGQDFAARDLLPGEDPVLVALRRGASADATLGFGLSRLLVRVARDLEGEETVSLRLALTRAALTADPAHDRARLLLAAALADGGEVELALAELAAVPANSPYRSPAEEARATMLAATGRLGPALALSEQRVTATGAGAEAWQFHADLLTQAGRHAEAARWLRRLVDGPDADDWSAWARLGNALDLAGQWMQARTALDRAVALAPQEPLALNNAGYARLAHGERQEGTRLLEHAARLDPANSSIADSLGWAYHLQGDHARALPLVESAARSEPTNAEIGDHLGDIYWSLGRRVEARYAWSAAELVATPAERVTIAAKLAAGPRP